MSQPRHKGKFVPKQAPTTVKPELSDETKAKVREVARKQREDDEDEYGKGRLERWRLG